MEAITWTLVAIMLSMLVYRYIRLKRKELYWKEKEVGFCKAEYFLSGLLQLIKNQPILETWYNQYKEFPNHKFVAVENLNKTMLMARDPEFVKKIAINDFQYFVDHGEYKSDKGTLINLGLFSLTGNEWRGFRAKLSPTFTTGKLKSMFVEMEPCCDALLHNIGKTCENPDYDIRDDIMTYAMDVSASVIFGIELRNKELREKYKKTFSQLFDSSTIRLFIYSILSKFPRLTKMLNLKIVERKMEEFFKDIIKQTFEQRKANNTHRNDYVQLLLNLKESGNLEVKVKDPDDDYLKTEDVHIENVEVTDDILSAQAFQFLTGGFEPIYNTMLMFLIEVARCEDIQVKLRKEIKEVKAKYGGYVYNSLKEMVYLEQCIQETLRKYPVVPFLMRYCVKDYVVNDRLTIENGTQIFVSLQGIQNDPAYFPNPEKFDPDRFRPNESIKNLAYLPFGEGPRLCIGMRFAMMEIKLGLAKILEQFSISPGEKAKYPIEMKRKGLFLCPCRGYLKMSKITITQ
ncbi:cytochrome P450 6B1-like [Cimex lectularius]|uniref:Cytochrome P450 n=1 Tax=Cimex lectularius TaxID=79782 RepID=A0A8I6RM98_CIMLE|nr:cytochrome P450 6B1-like [Cimex lectularius]